MKYTLGLKGPHPMKRRSSFLVCFSWVGSWLLDGADRVGKFLTQLKREEDYYLSWVQVAWWYRSSASQSWTVPHSSGWGRVPSLLLMLTSHWVLKFTPYSSLCLSAVGRGWVPSLLLPAQIGCYLVRKCTWWFLTQLWEDVEWHPSAFDCIIMVHIGLESSLLTPHSQLWEEVECPPTPTQFCTTPPSLHQEHQHAPHEVGRKMHLEQNQKRKHVSWAHENWKDMYHDLRKISGGLPFAQLAVSKSLKICM